MDPANIWHLGSLSEDGDQSQPYGWVLRSESEVTKKTSHDTRKLRQQSGLVYNIHEIISLQFCLHLPLPNHLGGMADGGKWEDRVA